MTSESIIEIDQVFIGQALEFVCDLPEHLGSADHEGRWVALRGGSTRVADIDAKRRQLDVLIGHSAGVRQITVPLWWLCVPERDRPARADACASSE
jgi:hypothetical protein